MDAPPEASPQATGGPTVSNRRSFVPTLARPLRRRHYPLFAPLPPRGVGSTDLPNSVTGTPGPRRFLTDRPVSRFRRGRRPSEVLASRPPAVVDEALAFAVGRHVEAV